MLIDWFTVAAQLLNFLVLVWLMKRFLYQPVLAAIAAREQGISAGLADAAARLDAAHKLDAQVAAKNIAFDQQRTTLLAEAVTAAQVQNAALLEQGKTVDAAQRALATAALAEEQERLCAAVTLQARDEVLAGLRQALTDLGDASLEDAMVRSFVRRLTGLDASSRVKLASAAALDPASAAFRTAFALDAHQQEMLTAALAASGIAPQTVHFMCAPHLLCGIELHLAGWSLAWSIDQYVQDFAKRSSMALHVDTFEVAR
jgi:F-type H+-transporting ATPase subunit b